MGKFDVFPLRPAGMLLGFAAMLLFGPLSVSAQEQLPAPLPDLAPGMEQAVAEGPPVIEIETARGTIVIQTLPEVAPRTVARVAGLAASGFYDGIIFHRVVPGVLIQGGDPTGTGTGGTGQKLKAEFSDVKHVAGTVAMARTPDPNSADSQFYIGLQSMPHLDGKYTVFGEVIEGMDVARRIARGDVMERVTVRE